MFAQRQFRLWPALRWTWQVFPVVGLWSAGLTAMHVGLGLEWVQLPGLPVTVLGTAVSFYLGFKGNASYERLWEARKIWGGIVNSSRSWGVFVTTLVSDLHRSEPGEVLLADVHRELVYRHVAWLAALRTQLRRPKAWEHLRPVNDRYREHYDTLDNSVERLGERIEPFVESEEAIGLLRQANVATQLLRVQGERLQALYAEGRIDDFRHMELVRLIETFYTLQGKCERIKNFPLPRQYASANHWFVKIFVGLLPLALLGSFHGAGLSEVFVWATVPASMLVAWVFYLWDRVLDYSENPFEGLINDIPMTALSRTIERDLREILGETTLPPSIGLIDDIALM